jgi:hypothetical protein
VTRAPRSLLAVLASFLFCVTAEGSGKVVFSTRPIDPSAPAGLSTTFRAGDRIYALMQWEKPLSEEYPGKDQVMLRFEVDGQAVHYQYVTFRNPALMKARTLHVDVAPDPGLMTAYKNPGLVWGTGQQNLRMGPEAYTFFLGKLSPGRHAVVLRDFDFGSSKSTGSFTVEGGDFSAYAKLHEQMKGAAAASATFPEAKTRNAALEAEMRKLLENAGWRGIRRFAIVDKDWWIDRVSGGDSPVESRHMDAAAEACDGSGCFYKVCTFHQRSLLGGGFGRLELTHQGDRRPLPE